MTKIHWTKNATFTIKDTSLIVVVELDKDKVQTSNLRLAGRERFSSVIKKIADTPVGPISANISVQTLEERERAA